MSLVVTPAASATDDEAPLTKWAPKIPHQSPLVVEYPSQWMTSTLDCVA